MATFTPPTVERPTWHDTLGAGIRYLEGVSVWRTGGTWYERQNPLASDIVGADAVATADQPAGEDKRLFFQGGRTYTVSAAVAALLTAQGYTTS